MKPNKKNTAKRKKAGPARSSSVVGGSAPSPVRWEYMTEHCRNGYISHDLLAAFGNRGWEMCGTVATPNASSDMSSGWPAVVVFYFKRALPNELR